MSADDGEDDIRKPTSSAQHHCTSEKSPLKGIGSPGRIYSSSPTPSSEADALPARGRLLLSSSPPCPPSSLSAVGADRGGSIKKWQATLKQFLRFCGPGYMIAVGYMDPGNWATDIEAGSRYGYALLFVILLSNCMAMILQHLCVRLAITTRMDLAQACRARLPRWANLPMYLIAEIAIISCDLAEVIGTAIALKLLFGLPIIYGVLLTVCDVLLLLMGLGGGSGNSNNTDRPTSDNSLGNGVASSPALPDAGETRAYRLLELVVMALMTIIGGCFLIELFIVRPNWLSVAYGFLPIQASRLLLDRHALFSALGIIGATVMPHNLYLHSSIVKYNLVESTKEDVEDPASSTGGNAKDSLESMINYATADSTIALFFALFINAAILITAAAAFHSRGQRDVQHIEDASALMRAWLGPAAAILFGLALLAAGQSSTVTGTVAGQIVFEGHLQMRLSPWLRRLITRAVAIVPALLIILVLGANSINRLLIYSQVILSFQLPFAIIPLIIFVFTSPREQTRAEGGPPSTSIDPKVVAYWESRRRSRWEVPLKVLSILIAGLLVVLNIMFLVVSLFD